MDLKCYSALKFEGLLPRDVWVWVPPTYQEKPDERFPVIYMQDGQNLFYSEKAYSQVTWGIAETIAKLSGWGFIQPVIVVGIDNTDNRPGDYLPTRPFMSPEGQAFIASLPEEVRKDIENFDFIADQYLKLMVEIIKPIVDRDFRTKPDLSHTIVMGSSMGALISLYALIEYPAVFGRAGCLSIHWPMVEMVILPYLNKYLPEPGQHKFYFDYGSEGFDADYGPCQAAVDEIGQGRGYELGRDWLTRFFPGADHHESAWRSRLHIPLRFFLG